MSDLRVGVAGAGVFGNYHAQKAAASGRTHLSGIFDVSEARAKQLADQFGVPAFTDFNAFLEASDAVIVAVP